MRSMILPGAMKILCAAALTCAFVTTTLVASTGAAIEQEIKRYGRDAKSLTLAPLHWHQREWSRFGEGTAAVAAVFLADKRLLDAVQRNRSSSTEDFARVITPFGGRRAVEISGALIIAGWWSHNATTRDAGRDSLESEIWAASVVTPLLKRAFGRARPIQNEGARSFHPFEHDRESFPSGHATNAFAFATAIADHYRGWVIPTLVYGLAGGVSLARVNDRVHFPSDVLAGALIGRAVAKGIVSRHRRSEMTWSVAPAMIHSRPALFVHFRRQQR